MIKDDASFGSAGWGCIKGFTGFIWILSTEALSDVGSICIVFDLVLVLIIFLVDGRDKYSNSV
jgi:hypothetical protein